MPRARVFSLLLVFSMALGACRLEVEPEQDTSLEPYVSGMLETAAIAWNDGDLDAFLSDYLDSPSTTFIGVGTEGLLTGVDRIRAHFAPRFEPGARRDSLRYESVRVRSLSPLIGLVSARYVLHGDTGPTTSGPVTLVVRWTGTDWRIIHDHTSTDSAPEAD